MPVNGEKAEWFLPLAGPMPSGIGQKLLLMSTPMATDPYTHVVSVLGPPIHRDAIAAPMSAEARNALAMAVEWADAFDGPGSLVGSSYMRVAEKATRAIRTYARSIAPPDPLAEARKALARIKASRAPDYCGDAVDRLEAALSKLAAAVRREVEGGDNG